MAIRKRWTGVEQAMYCAAWKKRDPALRIAILALHGPASTSGVDGHIAVAVAIALCR